MSRGPGAGATDAFAKMLAMKGRTVLFALMLLGLAGGAAAQQKPGALRPPYDGADSPAGPRPIHVDQNCRIVPTQAELPPGKKPRPYSDNIICHLESSSESDHWEEKIANNQVQKIHVYVVEHTFVLLGVADQPVMFVVTQKVPQGWVIDSDPQPLAMVGQTAYFHVYARPGETVRLHVGMRREWFQRPKPL